MFIDSSAIGATYTTSYLSAFLNLLTAEDKSSIALLAEFALQPVQGLFYPLQRLLDEVQHEVGLVYVCKQPEGGVFFSKRQTGREKFRSAALA